MAQFPQEAIGTFVGILIYSIICLFSSLLVIWLTFRHREWTSYVAILGYFTSLATICSIIQQIHVMVSWRDLMIERFHYTRAHADSPELTLTGVSLGVDRVLFYIQFYCYHVEGLIVMFWGLQLVQSLYRLNENPKLRRPLVLVNRGGKVFAILFPVVVLGCLQALLATKNYVVFDRLARQPLMWSVGIGCVTILAILVRYIQSRARLQKFNVTYANSQSLGTQHDGTEDGPTSSTQKPLVLKKNIYDRWLVTRFVIAFFILSMFELSIVLFSKTVRSNLDTEHADDKPDLSPAKAMNDFRFFAPGVTASLLTFLVFGTTKPFLKYMRECIFGPPKKDTSNVEYNEEPSAVFGNSSKASFVKGGIELVSPSRPYYTNMRDSD